jgi:hypothetical protein
MERLGSPNRPKNGLISVVYVREASIIVVTKGRDAPLPKISKFAFIRSQNPFNVADVPTVKWVKPVIRLVPRLQENSQCLRQIEVCRGMARPIDKLGCSAIEQIAGFILLERRAGSTKVFKGNPLRLHTSFTFLCLTSWHGDLLTSLVWSEWPVRTRAIILHRQRAVNHAGQLAAAGSMFTTTTASES